MIPCDLITELNPRDLLDAHRVYDPTFTALFYEPGSTEAPSKDDGNSKSKLFEYSLIIVYIY